MPKQLWIWALFAVLALMPAIDPAASSPSDDSISQVWTRENEFAQLHISGTAAEYVALFDTRFRGWACGATLPEDKSEINPKAKVKSFEIEREGGISASGLVTVFYRAHVIQPDGAGVVESFTHTWTHDGSSWKIISGMCRTDVSKIGGIMASASIGEFQGPELAIITTCW